MLSVESAQGDGCPFPSARTENSLPGEICGKGNRAYPFHNRQTSTNTLRGDGHVESIFGAGLGLPTDIQAFWYSQHGPFKSYHFDDNVWTYNGKKRSSLNRSK